MGPLAMGTLATSDTSGDPGAIAWSAALPLLNQAGLRRLALLGGGTLVSSIAAAGALRELWLTVCPILVGGGRSPTPCDGDGFLTQVAPRLQLLDCQVVDQEVFLHYRVREHVCSGA
jgi:5-amino-6-(5-phosphoribosylamino)uracil reductase